MKKNKKGFTLVEVVCGLMVLIIAISSGVGLFVVGATAYAKGERLAHNSDNLYNAFEVGASAEKNTANGITTTVKGDVYAQIHVNTPKNETISILSPLMILQVVEKNQTLTLYGFAGSYGTGG